MNLIKTAWLWLVYSSADPQKFSLSVKAALTLALTYGSMAAGLAHIQVPSEMFTQLIDAVALLIQAIAFVVSSIVGIFAFYRKVQTTLDGTNQVINTIG